MRAAKPPAYPPSSPFNAHSLSSYGWPSPHTGSVRLEQFKALPGRSPARAAGFSWLSRAMESPGGTAETTNRLWPDVNSGLTNPHG